jgi:hypothetical protein
MIELFVILADPSIMIHHPFEKWYGSLPFVLQHPAIT